MAKVQMYVTGTCPYCIAAERLLVEKGVSGIDKIRVDLEPQRRVEMTQKTGRTSVPQIWIGEKHIGGCDDLEALDRAGKLDALLATA
jgi:glutaredoxin 3